MRIYIFINYASSRQSQELLYILSLEFEPIKPETEPNRIGTELIPCWVEIGVAKPEPKPIRTDSFRDVDTTQKKRFMINVMSLR
jgi:hypothetical protein